MSGVQTPLLDCVHFLPYLVSLGVSVVFSLDERAMLMGNEGLRGFIRAKEEIIQYLITEYVSAQLELYGGLDIKPVQGRLFELEDGKDRFLCAAIQPRSILRLL